MIDSKITLDSIGGYDFQKNEARKIINFIKNYDEFTSLGASLPRGIIFYGEPGTGKTMFAHAIVNESGVPLFELDNKELGTDEGVTSSILTIFEKARKASPSVILIDEIDRIVPRGFFMESDKQREGLRVLLMEMDKLKDSGVLVIATSNTDTENLPSALIRNGRIEKHYRISSPTKGDREKILELYIKNNKYLKNINISDIASCTSGFSAVDLKSIVNDTIINCINENKDATFEDVLDSINSIRMHTGRCDEQKNVSHTIFHEIGHFVADYVLNNNIGMINAYTYGSVGGTYTRVVSDDDDEEVMGSRSELINEAIIAVSGVTATEVFLGEPYSGASTDYDMARRIYQILCSNGLMSSLELALSTSKDDLEISKYYASFIEKVKNDSKEILYENKELVLDIYNEMEKKKTLNKDELSQIVKRFEKKIPESISAIDCVINGTINKAYASSN